MSHNFLHGVRGVALNATSTERSKITVYGNRRETDGQYEGRLVVFASTWRKPSSARSSSSMKDCPGRLRPRGIRKEACSALLSSYRGRPAVEHNGSLVRRFLTQRLPFANID